MVITQEKYIVQTKNKTLTMKGFILTNDLRKSQVRLFNSIGAAKAYMTRYGFDYEIKKVLVQIEVLDND